jgi:hypothetical protein
MTKRIIAGAVVVFVLCLGWLAFASTQPPEYHDYRKTANEAAQAAHDAVRTTALTVQALLEHQVTSAYVSVVVDQATTAVAGAAQQLAAIAPPDDATAAMRAELSPLLAEATRQIGDVSTALSADQPDAIQNAAKGLGTLGDRFDKYLEEHG